MTALAHSYRSEIAVGLQISLLKVVYSHFGEFVVEVEVKCQNELISEF